MKNRYEFVKAFCPGLADLADYRNALLMENHQYLDDVVCDIKMNGCETSLINRGIGALKRRKNLTDFQDNQIDDLLTILEETKG